MSPNSLEWEVPVCNSETKQVRPLWAIVLQEGILMNLLKPKTSRLRRSPLLTTLKSTLKALWKACKICLLYRIHHVNWTTVRELIRACSSLQEGSAIYLTWHRHRLVKYWLNQSKITKQNNLWNRLGGLRHSLVLFLPYLGNQEFTINLLQKRKSKQTYLNILLGSQHVWMMSPLASWKKLFINTILEARIQLENLVSAMFRIGTHQKKNSTVWISLFWLTSSK